MPDEKVTIPALSEMKRAGRQIAMVTAYDYPTGAIADSAGADVVLVGDSVANVVLGYESTIPVTMDEMLHHTRAVRRAVKRALLVTDMPFMSYHVSAADAVKNAGRLIKEGGAEAVKIEGARCSTVRALCEAGISVMGHIGLTPQSLYQFGELKVQGSKADDAARLVEAAIALEAAGAFCIVVEVVPREIAAVVTKRLRIPVIGIGAGPECDGQVLVFHDLCGLNCPGVKKPKHVKEYASGFEVLHKAVKGYVEEVRSSAFPTDEHSFHLNRTEKQAFSSKFESGAKEE
ncbi:MAG: 3-methyl-2-oxobutanoate hydroxymethyltransferase [Candidatus Coatesbacteria bacterium]|nr:3-methyl-2-oxobutanoate hydroxymethyltransferase [Candidatus Coatesbacteria bacterium]